jgi:hypothetical protein
MVTVWVCLQSGALAHPQEGLGCAASLLPAGAAVVKDHRGMPRIERRGLAPSPLSVSRSRGALIAAVSDQGLLGVDVEFVRPVGAAALLRAAAAPQARNEVGQSPAVDATLAWWCGKEAALKSFGTGLRADPRAIRTGVPCFSLESHVREASSGERIDGVTLRRLPVGPAHVAVLAAAPGSRVRVVSCRNAEHRRSSDNGGSRRSSYTGV